MTSSRFAKNVMLVETGAPINIFGDFNRTSTCSIRWTIMIDERSSQLF